MILQEVNGFKSILSTFVWPNIGKLYFEVSSIYHNHTTIDNTYLSLECDHTFPDKSKFFGKYRKHSKHATFTCVFRKRSLRFEQWAALKAGSLHTTQEVMTDQNIYYPYVELPTCFK